MKAITTTLGAMLLAVFMLQAPLHAQTPKTHKVAIHVDDKDPARMNMALNNIANLRKYYDSKGETVEIELVAYGPGLHMLRADTSPVADRIATMSLEIENLTFSACGNTHAKMSKKAGKDVQLLDEAKTVPSGVVQLISLQEQGYAYIRP
jgi:intracellular sulfur oxidation DsrE/DsrF family protein